MEANRTELKLILEGLDLLRSRMRDDDECDDGEYERLLSLQDRVIAALEKLPY